MIFFAKDSLMRLTFSDPHWLSPAVPLTCLDRFLRHMHPSLATPIGEHILLPPNQYEVFLLTYLSLALTCKGTTIDKARFSYTLATFMLDPTPNMARDEVVTLNNLCSSFLACATCLSTLLLSQWAIFCMLHFASNYQENYGLL